MRVWFRTCQECFHKQQDKEPSEAGMSNAYSYRKCRKCKSEALDYGSYQIVEPYTDAERKYINSFKVGEK